LSQADVRLAQVVEERAHRFLKEGGLYDALIDFNLCFRIYMASGEDDSAKRVHAEWSHAYKEYQATGKPAVAASSIDGLHQLLKQIQGSRRK